MGQCTGVLLEATQFCTADSYYAPSVPCRPSPCVTHDLTATLGSFDGISFLLVIPTGSKTIGEGKKGMGGGGGEGKGENMKGNKRGHTKTSSSLCALKYENSACQILS